jgi:hypothetical protein
MDDFLRVVLAAWDSQIAEGLLCHANFEIMNTPENHRFGVILI